jgi:hypothetical protein
LLGAWLGWAADASLFLGVATQFAEMFAGAFFDGVRLIAPGGTGTTVDAANILEDVRPASRALHLHRFAVSEIGHDKPPRGVVNERMVTDGPAIGKHRSGLSRRRVPGK